MSWVTIHQGAPWEVSLRAGYLEEEGIPTFQPEADLKVINPFGTGAAPLDVKLQVPEEHAERALALLARLADEHEQLSDDELAAMALAEAPDPSLGVEPDEPGAPDDEEEEDAAARERGDWTREEIEALARRTRWGGMLGITAPLGVFFGWFYFAAVRETGTRDAAHGLTVAAFWLAVAHCLWPVVVFGYVR